MLSTFQKAAENFCIHQIRENFTKEDNITKKRTIIAYIDIQRDDSKEYRVYIASDLDFVQKVSMLFLEEDESDEETLIDMALEMANMIIGSAKVLAQKESKDGYNISTPHFEKIGKFNTDVDETKTIKLDDGELTVAIKELDV